MKLLSISSMLALAATMVCGQVTYTGSASTSLAPDSSGNLITSGSVGTSLVWQHGVVFTSTRKPKIQFQTIAQVRAGRAPVAKSLMAPVAYLKIAKEIGLESASTDEAKLAQVLQDRDIKIYNFDRVDAYLYNKAGAQSGNGVNYRWVWKAMRPKDQKAMVSDQAAPLELNTFQEGMGLVRHDLYKHAIPQRVIEAVACILEDAPDAIFLTSDYEAINPDPFLAVTTAKMLAAHKIFIIDSWDEPGFNDGREPIAVRQIAAR